MIYLAKNLSENAICNLKILRESGQFMGDDEVEIMYMDLEENCIVETTRKWYTTKIGRYVNIKGRRCYIDNKYRYCIEQKGDDFDFSNLRVAYYDYEDACLILKPINNLKLKDFKSSLQRNQLKNHIDWEEESERLNDRGAVIDLLTDMLGDDYEDKEMLTAIQETLLFKQMQLYGLRKFIFNSNKNKNSRYFNVNAKIETEFI